jgi:hypothetical protein
MDMAHRAEGRLGRARGRLRRPAVKPLEDKARPHQQVEPPALLPEVIEHRRVDMRRDAVGQRLPGPGRGAAQVPRHGACEEQIARRQVVGRGQRRPVQVQRQRVRGNPRQRMPGDRRSPPLPPCAPPARRRDRPRTAHRRAPPPPLPAPEVPTARSEPRARTPDPAMRQKPARPASSAPRVAVPGHPDRNRCRSRS